MATNKFAKDLKGFVVYDVKGEFDLESVKDLPNFDAFRYRITNENELSTIGFLPTIEMEVDADGVVVTEEEFVTSLNNFVVIKIGNSKKKIPAAAVKRKVKELTKTTQKEAEAKGEEFKLDKDMKDFFKEQAINSLLPECKNFVDEFETYLFFDKGTERLYVLVGNYRKAESLTGFLRVLLTSVPTVPVETEHPVSEALTKFVSKELNDKLVLNSYVKLEGDGGNVVWDKESVYDTGAKTLVDDSDFGVTKLALNYDGIVDFILDDELCFSGVKFDKGFFQSGSDFKADFLDVANELTKVVREVVKEINK